MLSREEATEQILAAKHEKKLKFDQIAAAYRAFAAEMGLQAFALMATAEGAVSAYAQITGDEWKPYEPPAAPSASTSRQSAAAQIGAFG